MLFKELNQYKYFFLDSIRANDDILTIYLTIGEVGKPEDISFNGVTITGTRPILENSSLVIELVFSSYVAYNVRWESYTTRSDYDIWDGRLIREYSKSRYMEYVKSDTIASDEWPGKLRHFGFCCEWHVVDVVSVQEPAIRILNKNADIVP